VSEEWNSRSVTISGTVFAVVVGTLVVGPVVVDVLVTLTAVVFDAIEESMVVAVVCGVVVLNDAARVDVAVDVLLILSVELAEAGETEPAEIKVEAVGCDAVVVDVALVVDVVVCVVGGLGVLWKAAEVGNIDLDAFVLNALAVDDPARVDAAFEDDVVVDVSLILSETEPAEIKVEAVGCDAVVVNVALVVDVVVGVVDDWVVLWKAAEVGDVDLDVVVLNALAVDDPARVDMAFEDAVVVDVALVVDDVVGVVDDWVVWKAAEEGVVEIGNVALDALVLDNPGIVTGSTIEIVTADIRKRWSG